MKPWERLLSGIVAVGCLLFLGAWLTFLSLGLPNLVFGG